jgi:hypothetical protein
VLLARGLRVRRAVRDLHEDRREHCLEQAANRRSSDAAMPARERLELRSTCGANQRSTTRRARRAATLRSRSRGAQL